MKFKENSLLIASILIIVFMVYIAVSATRVSAFDIVSSPTAIQSGKGSFNWYTVGASFSLWAYRPFIMYGTGYVYPVDNGFQSDSSSGDKMKITNLTSNIDLVEWFTTFSSYISTSSYFSVKYIFNKSTRWSTLVSYAAWAPFIWGGYLIKINGSNLDFYNINDFTGSSMPAIIQTIPVPTVGFSTAATSYGSPMPVYFDNGDWTHGFSYQWSDGKAYLVLDDFASGHDIPAYPSILWTGSVGSLWIISFYDLIFSRAPIGSGSVYVPDTRESPVTMKELSTNYSLFRFNVFQNPIAYFDSSSGVVLKWDLNCKTSWYDSCRLSSWVFKCTDSSGSLSPGWELCGWSINPPLTPGSWWQTISTNWQVCINTRYPIFSSNPYSIGNGTFSDNQTSTSYKFEWLANSNQYQDRLNIFPFYSGSILNTDTFTGWINAGVDTIISQNVLDTPSSISVSLTRTGITAPINYIKIKTDFQGYNFISSNFSNIVANVDFFSPDWKFTYPMTWSGWYATAFSQHNATNIKITFLVNDTITFNWFEVWIANSGSTIKTSCSNQYYGCNYYQQQPGIFSCDATLNPSGTPQGNCIISGGQCRPVTTTGAYYDWWINIPNVTTTTNSGGTIVGLTYTEEDIFACNETWLSTLICPFQIIKRIWGKFTDLIKTVSNFIFWISAIGSPPGVGNIIGFLIPLANADPGTNIKAPYFMNQDWTTKSDQAPTYTWSDLWGMNMAMFKASDSVKNMQEWGIKWVLAWAEWIMIFVVLMALIFLVVAAIKS